MGRQGLGISPTGLRLAPGEDDVLVEMERVQIICHMDEKGVWDLGLGRGQKLGSPYCLR